MARSEARFSVRLNVAETRARVDGDAIVLLSQGIASRTRRAAEGWELWVSDSDAARAGAALREYERENAAADPPVEVPLEYGRTGAGVAMGLLVLAAFVWTGPQDLTEAWSRAGAGSTTRILAGETWRTITALCLHADVPHALGNGCFLALFATAVCWTAGPGAGALLILVSGALGNGVNAWLHGPGHSSIGASTAVFGAVGLLAGIQAVRRLRRPLRRRASWLPLAAAAGLLAMLGTSERADLGAHLSGLAAGTVMGLGWAALVLAPPPKTTQIFSGVAAAGIVVAAWWRAFQ